MSEDFKTFLQGLLHKSPKRRLAWPDLLHHPFVRGFSRSLRPLVTSEAFLQPKMFLF